MKYIGMPMGMWALFARSFRAQLTKVFGYGAATARMIAQKAKPKYRKIIRELPAFEKGDRFQMNIVNCAMLGAFILCHAETPRSKTADGLLHRRHDAPAHAVVLPSERKKRNTQRRTLKA